MGLRGEEGEGEFPELFRFHQPPLAFSTPVVYLWLLAWIQSMQGYSTWKFPLTHAKKGGDKWICGSEMEAAAHPYTSIHGQFTYCSPHTRLTPLVSSLLTSLFFFLFFLSSSSKWKLHLIWQRMTNLQSGHSVSNDKCNPGGSRQGLDVHRERSGYNGDNAR